MGVLMEIGDEDRPTHVVTIHGCDGNGKYWWHDPETHYGEYLLVDYHWLFHMCRAWVKADNPDGAKLIVCPPGPPGPDEIFRYSKKWWDTLYINVTTANVSNAVLV